MSRLLPRTRGTVESVACPCCGHDMDLRKLVRKHGLQTGMEIVCDHCQDLAVVAAIVSTSTEGGDRDEISLRPKKG